MGFSGAYKNPWGGVGRGPAPTNFGGEVPKLLADAYFETLTDSRDLLEPSLIRYDDGSPPKHDGSWTKE